MAEGCLFEASFAADAIGATLRGDARASVRSVSIDSRTAGEGALFVALKGERVDGHAYAQAAAESGASALLVAEASLADVEARLASLGPSRHPAILAVPNTLLALQQLARAWRRRFPSLYRVGVTGSSGKTTTKECIAAVLAAHAPTVSNSGNLNSEIGLPLSMFRIAEGQRYGVFEMGINHVGEMDALASVLEPDAVLVTNIGTAHIGMFGSRDGIAAEKKRAFSLFDGKQLAFLPEEEEYLSFLSRDIKGRVIKYGPRSLREFEGARDLGLDGWSMRWSGREFAFPLPGAHNLLDALAACAVARELGVGPDAVAAGLSAVKPLFGRGEIVRGDVTVIRDCYNANPDSMIGAVEFCDGLEWKGRRVYVIGSMLELGASSAAEHERVGRAVGASKADAAFFFGAEARDSFEAARAAAREGMALSHFADFDELARAVGAYVGKGDLVLLKASRGMALERLADAIAGKAE